VDPSPLARAFGTVQVRDLAFSYPEADQPALTGIEFDVEPGQKLAVVGASGAGKSTLAKLLLRFFDPDSGSITLDGHDLRDLALADLRRNITPVLQETLVFEGPATEAVKAFPANVNVAAALSLAGIGPDRTMMEIWADPSVERNCHTIEIDSDSARFTLSIENIPSENPKTGRITALSVLAALRKLQAPLRVGT